MRSHKILLKMVIVGDARTSKTSVMQRFYQDKFSNYQTPTMGADFISRDVEREGKKVTLQIWDTAAEGTFKALSKTFYRDSDAFIITYDVTEKSTFENVLKIRNEILQYLDDPANKNKIPFYLVGTKLDLAQQDKKARQVEADAAQRWAEENGMIFLGEVSAKKDIGIKDQDTEKPGIFIRIATELLQKMPELESSPESKDGVGEWYDPTLSSPTPPQKRSKMAGIVTAAILIAAAIILSAIFWPLLAALTALVLVKVVLTTALFIGACALGATVVTEPCCRLSENNMLLPVSENNMLLPASPSGTHRSLQGRGFDFSNSAADLEDCSSEASDGTALWQSARVKNKSTAEGRETKPSPPDTGIKS
jgi:Ras-related protein Rab-7A